MARPEEETDPVAALPFAAHVPATAQAEWRLLNELGGVLVLDAQGRATRANAAAESILGQRRGDLLGRDLRDMLRAPAHGRADAPAPREEPPLRSVLREGRVARGDDASLTRADGEARRVDYVAVPLVDGSRVEGCLVLLCDAAERARREAALREQAHLLDLAHDAIFILDLEGRITSWNQGARRLYGWTPDEAMGRRAHELLQTRFPGSREEVLEAVLAKGRWEGQLLQVCKDGAGVIVESRWTAERDADGRPAAILEVDSDVSERRRVEDELRLRDRAVEAASNGLVVTGPVEDDNRLIYVNSAFERMTGYPREELLGRNCRFLQGEETDRAAVARLHKAVHAGREAREVLLNYRKDGTPYWNELYVSPIREPDGHVAYFVGVMHDVTDRVRAQEEIRQLNATLEARVRERTAELRSANAELEAFANSVSHDLRAPLRAIYYFAEVLGIQAPRLDEEGRDALRRIRDESLQLTRLVNDLLELSRTGRGEVRRERVDLSAVAARVVEDLRRAEPQRNVEVEIEPGLEARGDPLLLKVVLENLLGNAWKYTRRTQDARVRVGAQEVAGQRAFFVQDNGAGFPQAIAQRLFLPFQRLHSSAEFEGTGIGLATVERIVRRHGGRAWGEGEPDRGATFWFTLGPT